MTAVLSDDPGDGIMQSDARTGHKLSHYAEIWPRVSISTSAVKRSISFRIGFHSHREGLSVLNVKAVVAASGEGPSRGLLRDSNLWMDLRFKL